MASVRPRPRFRRFGAIAMAGVLVAGPVACSADGPQIDSVDRLPKTEYWTSAYGWQELPAAPVRAPRERWRIPVRSDNRGDYDVRDEVVVTLDDAGGVPTVRRINLADGSAHWSVPLPGLPLPAEVDINVEGSVLGVRGRQGPTDELVVLDAADGRMIWRGAASDAGVMRVKDMVLIGAPAGTMAVDHASGALRWQSPRTMFLMNGALVENTGDGPFVLLDPATAEPRWSVPRPEFGDAHVFGDTFLVTADVTGGSDTVVAYDLATGVARWSSRLPSLGRATSYALDDTHVLLAASYGETPGGFSVLDLTTGARTWGGSGSASTMRLDGKPFVLVDRDDDTTLNDAMTGKELAKTDVRGRLGDLAGGVRYVSDGNDIVAINLPELGGQWRVTGGGGSWTYGGPAPNGFMASVLENSVGELVGYIA